MKILFTYIFSVLLITSCGSTSIITRNISYYDGLWNISNNFSLNLLGKNIARVYVLLFSILCVCSNVYANTNDDVFSVALKEYCTASDKTVLQKQSLIMAKSDLEAAPADFNQEAIIDLVTQNQKPNEIDFSCTQLVLLSKDEISLAFKNKPKRKYPSYLNEKWAGFFEKFKDVRGVVSISIPGYSNDRKYAVIYFASSCGPLCGQSGLVQLKNVDGAWFLEKTEELTRS